MSWGLVLLVAIIFIAGFAIGRTWAVVAINYAIHTMPKVDQIAVAKAFRDLERRKREPNVRR